MTGAPVLNPQIDQLLTPEHSAIIIIDRPTWGPLQAFNSATSNAFSSPLSIQITNVFARVIY
jgi:hypothetical protein